jgi:conjugative transfer pilus assembly protein TraH
MQSLQATANAINKQNIDSCEAAKGIVNAAAPDTWQRGRQNAAKNFGVNTNIFNDITDAWTNVMSNEASANNTINSVATAHPELKDQLPQGNVVWKALKKMNGIDDEYRMILMSMVGTTIFPTSASASTPVLLAPKDISIQQLVGRQDTTPDLDFPIYRCVSSDPDCLNPVEGKANDVKSVKSFRYMVRTKMQQIADKIASRSAHDNLSDSINFLSVTDLPIYKMIAVATSLNNSTIADTLISRYQDLVAAKYAEVYIRTAVTDLNAAITSYSATVSDPAVGDQLRQLQPKLDSLRDNARQILADSYSQTVSTFNIAQEVQHMERALGSNLSQTLRSSLAFGKGLK